MLAGLRCAYIVTHNVNDVGQRPGAAGNEHQEHDPGQHHQLLWGDRPRTAAAGLSLFLEGQPALGVDVADPYYGGDSDYAAMLDVIEAAVPGWVARLREGLPTPA